MGAGVSGDAGASLDKPAGTNAPGAGWRLAPTVSEHRSLSQGGRHRFAASGASAASA